MFRFVFLASPELPDDAGPWWTLTGDQPLKLLCNSNRVVITDRALGGVTTAWISYTHDTAQTSMEHDQSSVGFFRLEQRNPRLVDPIQMGWMYIKAIHPLRHTYVTASWTAFDAPIRGKTGSISFTKLSGDRACFLAAHPSDTFENLMRQFKNHMCALSLMGSAGQNEVRVMHVVTESGMMVRDFRKRVQQMFDLPDVIELSPAARAPMPKAKAKVKAKAKAKARQVQRVAKRPATH
eukprot:TRINITY_DN54073_c0_g1_i1.p1 TRINITY_DN54073_c0_g1~~TRINITY_DN54073_c0_g1_i1.p1  ORF type:complete len:250 (+),score=38.81 TRINITY_DN54073_c0_g1_i1:41-751(+)